MKRKLFLSLLIVFFTIKNKTLRVVMFQIKNVILKESGAYS